MTATTAHRKAELRAAALARRSLVPEALRAQAAEAIAAHAAQVLEALRPRIVAGSMPFRGEVDPWPVLRRAAALGAAIALPAVEGEALVFRRWSPGLQLVRAPFGMLEPPADAEALTPDLILMPLVGFDRARRRLGYGRAYYDRTVAALRAAGHAPLLMGLAFAVQEVAAIPAEGHDVPLDWLVTEAGIIGP
ncbi:MAG: 5-formyltetrahydrofolate cyclo-ligase [Bauldia sp.]|nr:5-formyltetrahydrofolate cyclo-ligase [Bauldia sp.]